MSGWWSDFFWGEALWGDVDPEADDYVEVLVQLLPKGTAWDQWDEDDKRTFWRGAAAHEAARVELRVWQFLEELDPRTTLELLPDWERVYGLPEKCGTPPSTIDGRRRALHAKMAAKPQGNIPFFLQLASNMGYPDAEIRSLHNPFTCESTCIDSLFGWEGGWADAWMLLPGATAETDDTLMCMVPKYAQGHEHVLFRADIEPEDLVFDLDAETAANTVPEPDVEGELDGTTYDADTDSIEFNGTTDRVDFDSVADLSLPQPFTVEGWVRFDTLAGLRIIWVATGGTGIQQAMIFRANGSALELAHAYDTGTTLRRVSGNVFATGVWYHVAAVFPGTATAADVTLFVDGEEVPSYSLTTDGSGTPRSAQGPWSLGGREEADGTNHHGAIADRFRVYTRELSEAEIAAIVEQAFAPPTPLESTEEWP